MKILEVLNDAISVDKGFLVIASRKAYKYYKKYGSFLSLSQIEECRDFFNLPIWYTSCLILDEEDYPFYYYVFYFLKSYYFSIGKTDIAVSWLKRGLEHARKRNDIFQIICFLNELSLYSFSDIKKEYTFSLIYNKEAIFLARKNLFYNSILFCHCLYFLASKLITLEQVKKAKKILLKLLEILQSKVNISETIYINTQIIGFDHNLYLTDIDYQLGCIYLNENKYHRAEELFEKSLSLRIQIYGYENYYTIQSMSKIGEVKLALHDYKKAKFYSELSVKNFREYFYGIYSVLINLLEALYHVYVKTNEPFEKLDKIYLEIAELKSRVYDSDALNPLNIIDHFDYLVTLGIAQHKQENISEALDYYCRASTIPADNLGEEAMLKRAHFYSSIAEIYLIQGEYATAKFFYEEAIKITFNITGQSSFTKKLQYSYKELLRMVHNQPKRKNIHYSDNSNESKINRVNSHVSYNAKKLLDIMIGIHNHSWTDIIR